MPRSRAIVWMDFGEASIFRFGSDEVEQAELSRRQPLPQGAPQGRIHGCWLSCRRPRVFGPRHRLPARHARLWYLTGPDGTKQDLVGYLDKYKTRDCYIAELRLIPAGVSKIYRPTDDGLLSQRARG